MFLPVVDEVYLLHKRLITILTGKLGPVRVNLPVRVQATGRQKLAAVWTFDHLFGDRMDLLHVDAYLSLIGENGITPVACYFAICRGRHRRRYPVWFGSRNRCFDSVLAFMHTLMPVEIRFLVEHFGASSASISLGGTVQVPVNMQPVGFVLGYLFITRCAAVNWLLVVALPVVEFKLNLRFEQLGTLVAGYCQFGSLFR